MASTSFSFISRLVVVHVLLLINVHLVQSNDPSSTLHLTVNPSSGRSAENIEIRCQIHSDVSLQPLTSTKFDNVYLVVKTDHVKPSGIVLKFDDSNDRCETSPAKPIQIDVCNATLIHVRINHTLLNDTLEKIDYSCAKGSTHVMNSYHILRDQSARFFDPLYNRCSVRQWSLNLFFIIFVLHFSTERRRRSSN